jgi:hypothetical protein
METMSGTEGAPQAEKKILVAPIFGKEIVALVEANVLQRESAHHTSRKDIAPGSRLSSADSLGRQPRDLRFL